MPAGSTYTPIATYTVPSAQASYTFSSIPATYTDLVLITTPINGTGNRAFALQLNGDTGTNYSYTQIGGDGSTAVSSRSSNSAFALLGNSATTQSSVIANFQDYANTTTHKTFLVKSSLATVQQLAIVNLWRSTAAINSIKLYLTSADNFAVGATFTLYGIKAAT